MKTTGIVRKIDELGRIVLPKELRKCLNINTGDDFQIRVEDEKIILEKYSYLKNYEQEILKIINCPALALFAIKGAKTSKRTTFSLSCCLLTILNIITSNNLEYTYLVNKCTV